MSMQRDSGKLVTKKAIYSTFLFIFALIHSSVIFAASMSDNHVAENSVSILFVGNSHVRTGNVPEQLQTIARMHGIEITVVDVSRNGANLDSTMRDEAIREMQNRSFDYVVMQARGRSIRPTNDVDGFLSDIRIFSEQIRENGAIPVLYSPAWANVNGQPDEELQQILTQAHKQAAYENDAILINAGDAWVYAYRAIPGLSLYARDGMHANHAGAFLTASVFAATLFDLHIENSPASNVLDNLPMLDIITFAFFASLAVTVAIILYRLAKRQPLSLHIPLMTTTALALLNVMSLFPHVFRFTTSNRLLLLYSIVASLLAAAIYSLYRIVRMKLLEKQPWDAVRKHLIKFLTCVIIYSLTFTPTLELRLPLYMGNDAAALAQAAWNFVHLLQ